MLLLPLIHVLLGKHFDLTLVEGAILILRRLAADRRAARSKGRDHAGGVEHIPHFPNILFPNTLCKRALGLWCYHRRPVLPTLRRLLKRIRQLQDAELVLMASDNLHADG